MNNMSVILNIILFIVCVFVNDRRGQIQAQLNFPHLVDFNEDDIGKPFYTFEGVDYEKLPKYLYKRDFRTCYDEYTRCARLIVYNNIVCGYWRYQNRLLPFYSICELDLISCKDMLLRKKIDMYGTTYRERAAYFMGEGKWCEIFKRRSAEGSVPRDLLDLPEDESKYDVVTSAKDLQYDKTKPSHIPNSEYYDYENYPDADPLSFVTS